ncbi:MAG: outer membrane lipoprotein-sorting protein [Melioribacteraceae bacterium]|nr:outer membrane lipoprotein-sorting protein [Melioribacteraceae bacterium]MCF8356369.1 outer membrane lipoprotein-sorting protein [Melioribacteraceae bacterium]MCF8392263.1 outer membrane lipoprotein-sorting protein [Melioribacteraceae bacterium]MCF8417595.1 outer membrane lipoprotein-sorting protein [Melioribacteraceae bacterium]
MKVLKFAAVIFLFSTVMFAQTLEEVLNSHFEATGTDKLAEVSTVITNGKVMQASFEIPIKAYNKRPMKFRSEGSFQGMEIVTIYDGESGWSKNPFMGSNDFQQLPQDQLDQIKDQADFEGMLFNWEEKGYNVTLDGTEDFEGIETYVVTLSKKNGDVYKHFIDTENFILLKMVSKINFRGVETEATTLFSNYKEVNGMVMPFETETLVNGQTAAQISIESVEFNKDVPDSLFEVPETVPAVEEDSTKVDEK